MLRAEEAYWICTNRDCGKTAAWNEPERQMETRTCECGSLMKRMTHATVFSYLNFLREVESNKIEESKEKEETPCER